MSIPAECRIEAAMSVRKSGRRNSAGEDSHPAWQKAYSVTIEVDVAKILGVIALFALAILCTDGPSEYRASRASSVNAIWRFLLPVQDATRGH
jgi:hypothetical protein